MSQPPSLESWPALPYPEWADTLATLHRWSQIVGKVRMVRVGSGEANAKAIGDLLAELLGPAEKAEE